MSNELFQTFDRSFRNCFTYLKNVYFLVNPQIFFIKQLFILFEVISFDRLPPTRRRAKRFSQPLFHYHAYGLKCLADHAIWLRKKYITYFTASSRWPLQVVLIYSILAMQIIYCFLSLRSGLIDIFQKNLFNYSDAELKIKSAVSFAGFFMSFEFISIWWIQLFTMAMLCSCCFSTIF